MPNLVRGTAVAVAVVLVSALGAASASAEHAHAPKPEVMPSIPTAASDGRVLTVDPGKWQSATPVTYTYKWQRCQKGTGCTTIAGVEEQSYRLRTEDIGSTIRVFVTATNENGSKTKKTNKTGTVQPGSPLMLEFPSISGTDLPGETLTASNGTWVGTPVISYTYQWLHCEVVSGECHEIGGAHNQTYKIEPTEAGDGFVVIVTATNPYGKATARSAEVTPPVPAPGV